MKHETQPISLKEADIDIEMIPVVKWLNSFDGVNTRHCCEGDDGSWEFQKPYITFTCNSLLTLAIIVEKLTEVPTAKAPLLDSYKEYGRCEVQWQDILCYGTEQLLFDIRFNTKARMLEFIETLDFQF